MMRIDPTPPAGRADRVALGRPATMRDPTRAPFDMLVDNLSETGALLRGDARLPTGSLVSLGLAGLGMQIARVVRTMPGALAIEFMVRLEPQEVARAAVPQGTPTVVVPQILAERAPATEAPAAGDAAVVRSLPVTPLPGPGEPVAPALVYGAAGRIEAEASMPPRSDDWREDQPKPDARALWFSLPGAARSSGPGLAAWLLFGAVVIVALVWLLV